MKPIAEGDRRVANIKSSAFRPWSLEGGEVEAEVLQVNGRPDGVGFHVYRMAPGSRSTAHEHTGDEEFLVLEGELIDHDGTVYRKGDLVWLREGTRHSSFTPHGCLLAVHIASAETALEDDEAAT